MLKAPSAADEKTQTRWFLLTAIDGGSIQIFVMATPAENGFRTIKDGRHCERELTEAGRLALGKVIAGSSLPITEMALSIVLFFFEGAVKKFVFFRMSK